MPYSQYITIRREPGELKHLSSRRKRKKVIDFLSSGERKGKSPNRDACISGFGPHTVFFKINGKVLGKPAKEGESPVHENQEEPAVSRVLREITCRKAGGPPPKAKYYLVTDSA